MKLNIIDEIKHKNRRALSRAISLIENQHPDSINIIKNIYPLTGKAHYIGITGNPGSGKSTLVNVLIKEFIDRKYSVAVLAIDPASPNTGGAILGDRIRMDDYINRENVYFRSLSNRNHLGGLSQTTYESLLLLDAFGFDKIIIETVGTGQSETDISTISHTNLVVTVPGLGDEVQAEKAGILEIGDIFVINKSDLSGAESTKSDLKRMIHLRHNKEKKDWKPPVVLTQALNKIGIDLLIDYLDKHFNYIQNIPNGLNIEKIIKQKTKFFIDKFIEQNMEKIFSDIVNRSKKVVTREKSHIEIAEQYANEFINKNFLK